MRVDEILRLREQLEAHSKTFRFGLSLGWRHIIGSTGSKYREVAIDPTTNEVVAEEADQGDFVLSGIVTAFPFRRHAERLGFLANVNLASFNTDNLGTFNKSLEGGFGLAWRLNNDFSLGATIERMFSRSLRDFVKVGSVLIVNKDTIKTLAKDDGRFFRDDNVTALSFKFLYFLK